MSRKMEWANYKAMVVGCGSIGRRHVRNLKALGIGQFAFCDKNPEALKQCNEDVKGELFTGYREALRSYKPDFVLICTPPVYHVDEALAALQAGAHVFIEKPLSHESAGVDVLLAEARRHNRNVQVGYNLRFHPGLQILKELIESGKIGRVLWLNVEAGQYLPDWRPWQNYRDSYSARHDLGGGIILDGSHELDYICWLLGWPTEVSCRAEHLSSLELDVEDSAWIYLTFPDRRRAELHLDFVQRSYTRTCKVVGESGTALWDFTSQEVRWFSAGEPGWKSIPYKFEVNDMYVTEMSHFLGSLGSGTGPLVDLEQGRDVIRVVEAAKKSSVEGLPQRLNWTSENLVGPVVAIIQARMGSSRLPGKSLAEVEGRPMLWHVIERVKRACLIDRVVVATSTAKADDAIEATCRDMGVTCYRGSENDVLDRYYMAARAERAPQVVRITADCPLIDPEVVDRVVRRFQRGDVDYATNAMVRTYPDGLDTEVFSFSALERAWHEANKTSEREHVTPYLRMGKFRTANVECDSVTLYQHYRWTVDEAEDLDFIRAVYRAMRGRERFGMPEVLELLEQNPGLEKMNSEIVSNRGYYKSLFLEAQPAAAPPHSIRKSNAWHERANQVIPGCAQTFSKGSNQHVRGVAPLFLAKGKGYRVWDVDGNEYIDYIQGLLPNILGYAHDGVNTAVAEQLAQGHSFSLPHPLEVELAERITRIIPCAEKVRFGKNGSDATSGAVRAARALTGRDRIACCGYHGWQDWYIGSTTRNAGVPGAVRALTHGFQYNNLESLGNLLEEHPGEFAAVIMEPVNFSPPAPGFLAGVKELTHRHGALLIFDEICTGFHFGLGGAQKKFGVTPDMACFGKAMGNGFPISCIVGRADVMNIFEDIFFSFTFGGEIASMAAAMKVLDILETTPAIAQIEANGRVLKEALNALAKEAGLHDRIKCIGYPFWSLIRFLDEDGKDSLLVRSLFTQECVKRGVLMLATHNMTAAHDPLAIEKTLKIYAVVCKTMANWLGDRDPEQYLEGEMIQPVFKVR
ncbi:MAG TPA: aminotransferase class III-fold pyridoxal phosphate-dependent enzyme [Terriglobales bacterium]|nr:aminotransferase class III-fold pyridoxal phosphate-dependent enzyme [Terriglobales bacterium]